MALNENEVPMSKKIEILVVDDSTMMTSLARRILETKNYLVTTASSGEECLEYVKNHSPNLILLDVFMKGMDGFEVLHELKARTQTSSIPVIFLTGDEHNETEIRGLHEGAVDFISKPFIPGILIQRVQNTIELSLLQKNLQREVDKQAGKLKRLTQQIMLALSSTVDAKDHYTRGHSFRVAKYSKEIARRLGRSEQFLEDIYAMGLLHDIGKIGVAGSIIRKDSRLTDEEYADIKEHTITGYNILKNITELPGLAIGARWHHEHYDGTGYPDGLKGQQIPEEARIIAVADAYDAMTSKRTYTTVRPQAEVRAEIERCKGTHFDPEITEIFLKMIDEDTEYTMREDESNF
ncbi:HD domain-containing phosphohydrolase [Treponema sp.]|uniref:HD domain-containing phosphohydrolase n=1 Tax=Treponema sp. TaxID=166 RepID=UPI00388FFBF2